MERANISGTCRLTTSIVKIGISLVGDDLMRLRAFTPAVHGFLDTAQRSAEDPNLHHLDGRDLYGEADFAELPLPDQLHPDAATHRRMGERFAKVAFGAGGALSVPPS